MPGVLSLYPVVNCMWYWLVAVAIAVVLLLVVPKRITREQTGNVWVPMVSGAVLGIAASILVGSYDADICSLGVFGAHLSLFALGVVVAVASALSESFKGVMLLVSGTMSAALLALVYVGQLGIYVGTLLLMGIACLSSMMSDFRHMVGPSPRGLKADLVLASSIAVGTLLLCLGVEGLVHDLADQLSIQYVASAAAVTIAELLACTAASKGGGFLGAAATASAMTVFVGATFIASTLIIRGMVQ